MKAETRDDRSSTGQVARDWDRLCAAGATFDYPRAMRLIVGPPRTADQMLELLGERSADVRYDLALALGSLDWPEDGERCWSAVLALLEDRDVEVRCAAMWAVVRSGHPAAAVTFHAAVAREPESTVRHLGAGFLDGVRTPRHGKRGAVYANLTMVRIGDHFAFSVPTVLGLSTAFCDVGDPRFGGVLAATAAAMPDGSPQSFFAMPLPRSTDGLFADSVPGLPRPRMFELEELLLATTARPSR